MARDRDLSAFLRAADVVDRGADIVGVLKARASTNRDLAFMWESRFRECLLGFGFTASLAGRPQPFQSVGLSLSYFSGSS